MEGDPGSETLRAVEADFSSFRISCQKGRAIMRGRHAYEVVALGHSQFRLSVTPVVRVKLFPFLLETERVLARRKVDAQHSVEVIDFVLQEFSKSAKRLDPVSFSGEVLVDDFDLIRTLDSHQKIRERETIVPYPEILVANVGDYRIENEPGSINPDIYHPHWCTDLRCCQTTAHATLRSQMPQRFL
jgi:hypothetical protein